MILVRADANEMIGAGHVMRCLSIADAFRRAGHEVVFVTADHRGDNLIQNRGFRTLCLESEWTQMDGENVEYLLKLCKPDLYLVDSYYVSSDYLSSVSTISDTVYIDDLNTCRWDVQYLVNYSICITDMDYSKYKSSNTKLFLGTKYAPLRQEFRDIPEHTIKPVTDIMVSTGGADPERIIEKLISRLCPRWRNITFHFIIGALNTRRHSIEKKAPPNSVLHVDEKDMSGLMKKCDIAISAAGSTLYELCACGTPTITYAFADNQVIGAGEFDKQGIMVNAGDCRNNPDFIQSIETELNGLMKDMKKRQEFSSRMQTLVDGFGADRLVADIMKYKNRFGKCNRYAGN